MPVQEQEVLQLLTNYGKDIRLVLQLLEEHFAIANPILEWRSKHLDRVGFLDVKNGVEYSMHGAGCTVEFGEEKLVSFDIDETGNYCFDAWKFKLYADSVGMNCDSLEDHYVKALAKSCFYSE